MCTPDFFGFNRHLELQYRGRLDAARKERAAEGLRRDLFEAMREVVQTGSAGSDPLDGLLDQVEGCLTGIAVVGCPQQPPCFFEPAFHCQAQASAAKLERLLDSWGTRSASTTETASPWRTARGDDRRPGLGKTSTLNTILLVLTAKGTRVLLAAPTGRV